MTKQKFDINQLRVASPCSVGWATMAGDERVRHCQSCQLNIYNTAEMTKNEVEDLIANREGKLCIRLYKRADGTVLTKDCPVGFRAYQKRVARFAGATLATILGLFSISFGQKEQNTNLIDASKINIVKTQTQSQIGSLSGVIVDANDGVIPEAEIRLYKENSKKVLKTKSDDYGKYSFEELTEGNYILEVKFKGFTTQKVTGLMIKSGDKLEMKVEMSLGQEYVTVGIYAEEPLIDINSTGGTTTVTRQMIDRLPH
jgi:Carboxypeptidase regulatory-like domain